MIKLTEIQLNSLAVHRVGNKNRAEKNFISKNLFALNEEMTDAFTHFFTKSLKRADDYYRFQDVHDGFEQHPLYQSAKSIFSNPQNLLEESVKIVDHLYFQSVHPKIKSGEVFVAYFSGILIEDEMVSAIGIFKSEQKSNFFDVKDGDDRLVVKKLKGINVEKLDKGALIINTEDDNGYRLISVDNNSYDANYWLHDFLNVVYVKDENFHTKSYLQLCNDFSNQIFEQDKDKEQQIRFLNESYDYFNSNETFDTNEFIEAVMPAKDEFVEEFKSFKHDYNLGDLNQFPISSAALKTASKKLENTIKLDTKIQIKLDYSNPEGSRSYLEKGFDQKKGMNYYKVYFNEEL